MIQTKIESRLIKNPGVQYALWRSKKDVIALAKTIMKEAINGIVLYTNDPDFMIGDSIALDINEVEPFDGKLTLTNDEYPSLPKIIEKKKGKGFLERNFKEVIFLALKVIGDNYWGMVIRSEDFNYTPFTYIEVDIKDFKDADSGTQIRLTNNL